MTYSQPGIPSREWDTQTPLWFWDTKGTPNLGQTTGPREGQQEKRTYQIVDVAIPADHRVKLNDEKRDKYLDLARELKKLWNIKVTVIPFVVNVLATILRGLGKELENSEIWGQVDTIQTRALLKSDRILRRVLETWGDLLSLKLRWKKL